MAAEAGKIGEVGLPADFTACPFACGSREKFRGRETVDGFQSSRALSRFAQVAGS